VSDLHQSLGFLLWSYRSFPSHIALWPYVAREFLGPVEVGDVTTQVFTLCRDADYSHGHGTALRYR
jgi:hypothetical protein